MTKNIRIENADNSKHVVLVEVWEKSTANEDRLVETVELKYPTDMVAKAIWSNRYLIIREAS